ncbi:MAG: 50S ribosomal protein L9 [Patescibacteria group bacterium]
MKVLLMQDVAKLGKKYEIKEVSSGYARNLLIPSGKAVTPEIFSAAKISALQEKHLHAATKKAAELTSTISALAEKRVVIKGKANEEGHLFAGISKDVIAEAIKDQLNITVATDDIHLGHALKAVGSHEVEVGQGNKIEVIVEAEG